MNKQPLSNEHAASADGRPETHRRVRAVGWRRCRTAWGRTGYECGEEAGFESWTILVYGCSLRMGNIYSYVRSAEAGKWPWLVCSRVQPLSKLMLDAEVAGKTSIKPAGLCDTRGNGCRELQVAKSSSGEM